ncbi:alanine racemase C-terminal domain-containing protein [Pseudoclavibacter helvolus]|uniref:alanine racemase C-terminal domain-containing protein n=1 Tax=Pseudoclavibacter helvolus TaxID=255205 RepID=UPI003C750616
MRRRIHIDLRAIRENATRLLGSETASYADLRADAYGHGAIRVAEALDGVGFAGFIVSPELDQTSLSHLRTRTLGADAVSSDKISGGSLFGLSDRAYRPAMRVSAEVLAVKDVEAGEGVSYGYSYVTTTRTQLALVGVGYAHGVVRRASNTAPVLIGGQTRTIVGAISMDQFSVDLLGADVAPGDLAVLFGDPAVGEPSILDWQHATGLRASAIASRMSPRFERSYT